MSSNQPVFQHAELDGNPFHLQGSGPTGVLCIHGLTATTTEVRPLAEYLNANGFTAFAPLLPGHGTSPEDLNKATWMDWIDEAKKGLTVLKQSCASVYVAGESMGGLVALWLAAHDPQIQGALLYAPAISIRNDWAAGIISRFIPFIQKRSTDDSMPWKGYYVNPTRAVYQLFLLQKEIRSHLHKVNQPVLIFQGALDQTVIPEGALEILKKINSEKKGLIWLKDSTHCLLLDREQAYVFSLSCRFIQSTVDKA
jgi:carboxylesterase